MVSISFFYIELLNLKDKKGVYFQNDAIPVYDKGGLEVVLFPSRDYRHCVCVKRFYGHYESVEI